MSKEQKRRAMEYPKGSDERIQGLAYSKSYLGNTLALKQGKRKLTKDTLMPNSSNSIQLKGCPEKDAT